MRITVLLVTVVLIFLSGSGLNASNYMPGELLVKYMPGISSKRLQGELGKIGWAKVKVEKRKTMSQAMTNFKNDPDIILVEVNYYGEFLSEPDDPGVSMQWYLANIEVPEAWDKALGEGVIVGLVDSGVEMAHEDLLDNILTGGWDYGDNDDDPNDEYGHGTMVCGVIAAVQNNSLGISGIAPKSKILPLKVSEGNSATFTASTVAEAIIYASDQGANIINLSLALGEYSQTVTDAVEYASSKGILLVAAAGHEVNSVRFPANLEDVIAVSATDETDRFWSKSNQGPEIELSAPGKDIYTTQLGGGYTTISGTSLSAPMVSAVAALLISHYPGLTSDQVRDRLTMKADDLGDEGKDELYGYGKVNALRTLDPVDADNDVIISVGDGFGLPGSTDNMVEISLDNPDIEITGAQFQVCDADDFISCTACDTAAHASDFECLFNEADDGCCNIIIISYVSDVIEKGSGPIANVNFDVSEDAPEDECKDLSLANVQLSDNEGEIPDDEIQKEEGEFCFQEETTTTIDSSTTTSSETTSSTTTTIPADVKITVHFGLGGNLLSVATFPFVSALAKTIPENNDPPLIFYASLPDLPIPTPAIEVGQNFYFGLFVSSYCIEINEVALTWSYGPFLYGPNIKGGILGLPLYFQLPEEDIETIILEVLESYRPKLEKLNKELSKMSEIEIMSLTLSNEEEQLEFLNKVLE